MNESPEHIEGLHAKIDRQRAHHAIMIEQLRQERRISERRLRDIVGLRNIILRLENSEQVNSVERRAAFAETAPPTIGSDKIRRATCLSCEVGFLGRPSNPWYSRFLVDHADCEIREKYKPGHAALWEQGDLEAKQKAEITHLSERIAAQKIEIARLRGTPRKEQPHD